MSKMIGIYTITNIVDNKIYVGESININSRLYNHLRMLKNNKHSNTHLQNSYNLYGENNFKFEILEECNKELNKSQENYWCNMLNTHDRNYGFNLRLTAPDNHYKVTDDIKNKISIKNKGKQFKLGWKCPEDVKIKISKSNIGRKCTIEFKEKCSKRMKNHKFSKETLLKISKSVSISKKGIKFSDVHKKKLSALHKKPILQYSLDDVFIREWESALSTKEFGFGPSNVTQCCKGNFKQHLGFIWKYKTI